MLTRISIRWLMLVFLFILFLKENRYSTKWFITESHIHSLITSAVHRPTNNGCLLIYISADCKIRASASLSYYINIVCLKWMLELWWFWWRQWWFHVVETWQKSRTLFQSAKQKISKTPMPYEACIESVRAYMCTKILNYDTKPLHKVVWLVSSKRK